MKSNVIAFRPEYEVTTEQAEKLLTLQGEILEKVVLGIESQLILNDLCKVAEQIVSDAVASIMIYDDEGESLIVLAAPSIPLEAIQALNGLIPSKTSGSCGTAVYSNRAQYVTNTKTDYRWCNLQTFADDFSIRACWSSPIKTSATQAIGSFALSSFEKRIPSAFYKKLLEVSAHIVGILIKREQEQRSLWNLAHYDALTGLANRTLLHSKLESLIKRVSIQRDKLAIFILDLDDFKDVNEAEGHDVGDLVLQDVAKKIKACLNDMDIFARLGGDEFVIVMEYSKEYAIVERFFNQILGIFKHKIMVAQHEFSLSTSIGISLFPEDGLDSKILLRNADTAMYEAKKSGRNCARFYNEELTRTVQHKIELIAEMRVALKQNDFVVYYQPQFCQKTGTLSGAEALVRWQHPEKGLIPPNDFIPIAEECGFIKELGLWIFTTACQQCKTWWDNGMPEFFLAINLSVKQLNSQNIQQFQDILSAIKFPIQNLEIEILESLIMQQESLEEIHKLEALGIAIAMDDFGTGHSSLSLLKYLPISKLKIDRSFVKDLCSNENDKVIVKTIIGMGHTLGLKVLAEGVETKAQQDFLIQENCDFIQGYLLGRPVEPKRFFELFG